MGGGEEERMRVWEDGRMGGSEDGRMVVMLRSCYGHVTVSVRVSVRVSVTVKVRVRVKLHGNHLLWVST